MKRIIGTFLLLGLLLGSPLRAFISPDPEGHVASMDLYSYCNGDPVNQYDADGRLSVGFNSGLNGNISANAPTSSAFYFGNLIGGGVSGAGSGAQNGAGGSANALTFGSLQGAFGSDPSSAGYKMGRNITYSGMATVAAVGTGGFAGGAVLGTAEASVATGAFTEAGFTSAVPAAGTGAANILSLAGRQVGSGLINNANVTAPGGVMAATYALANSQQVLNVTQAGLSAFGISSKNPPSPTTPWWVSFAGFGNKLIH